LIILLSLVAAVAVKVLVVAVVLAACVARSQQRVGAVR